MTDLVSRYLDIRSGDAPMHLQSATGQHVQQKWVIPEADLYGIMDEITRLRAEVERLEDEGGMDVISLREFLDASRLANVELVARSKMTDTTNG